MSSMLKKKTTFKPKAPPRRNGPVALSQDKKRTTTAERKSQTPPPTASSSALPTTSSTSPQLVATPTPSLPAPSKAQGPGHDSPKTKFPLPCSQVSEASSAIVGVPEAPAGEDLANATRQQIPGANPAPNSGVTEESLARETDVISSASKGVAAATQPFSSSPSVSDPSAPASTLHSTRLLSPAAIAYRHAGGAITISSRSKICTVDFTCPTATVPGPIDDTRTAESISEARCDSATATIAHAPSSLASVFESQLSTARLPAWQLSAPVAQQSEALTCSLEGSSANQPRSSIEGAGCEKRVEPAAEPKTTRGRRRKPDGAGDADLGGAGAGPARKKRAAKKGPVENDKGEEVQSDGQTSNQPRTRERRVARAADGEADGEGGEAQACKKRRERSATPEDAENIEVDITQVKMADLAKDLRIGKKFSMHNELLERQRARRKAFVEKRKLRRLGIRPPNDMRDEGDPKPSIPKAGEVLGEEAFGEAIKSGALSGHIFAAPSFQIVDGEIRVDERSLQVDRHARARAAAADMEEEEENEFTRLVTSATYLKKGRRLKPNQWTDEETELFYRALGMFGTDFETISRMFPDKQRRHIKLKFNREERESPRRVNAALVGEKKVVMDLEEYKGHTGLKYESTEAIYAEHNKREEEFEERQREAEKEIEEEARRKREELFGGRGAGNGSKGNGSRNLAAATEERGAPVESAAAAAQRVSQGFGGKKKRRVLM